MRYRAGSARAVAVEVEIMTAAATPTMGSVTNQTIAAQEPIVPTVVAAVATETSNQQLATRKLQLYYSGH